MVNTGAFTILILCAVPRLKHKRFREPGESRVSMKLLGVGANELHRKDWFSQARDRSKKALVTQTLQSSTTTDSNEDGDSLTTRECLTALM